MKAAILAAGLLAAATASAGAATITSGNFSLGYGYANDKWSTDETSSISSPNPNVYLSGNFTLGDVTFTGIKASNGGVGFADRILGHNGTNNQSGYIGVIGVNELFSATITGSYTGPTPADAAANPNYQVEVNITAIKIYAAQFGASSDTVNWTETTAGNVQSQSPQAVGTAGVSDPANYVHIGWNPAEFLSPVGSTSQTRSFGLGSNNPENIALDGFEIFGNMVLHYDAVPEPASLGLLSLGGLAMRRRRRASITGGTNRAGAGLSRSLPGQREAKELRQ